MTWLGQNRLFVEAARELADKSLEPRVRLYRTSSDGLKLRILREFTLHELERMTGGVGDIETYALAEFDIGFYCAKLFCTKYGRNILERRYDFAVGGTRDELIEDEKDEEYF